MDLLEFITDISIDNDFQLLLWSNTATKGEHDQLVSNFSYLKTLADELFFEEISQYKNLKRSVHFPNNSDPKSFKNSRYSQMNCQQLIQQGEGKFIEFKRTLQVNLETKKQGNKAKHAIAKTLAAYFNSGGGVLLIGVADNKEITGLDADFESIKRGENHDNFRKSFDNLISTKFGSNFHHLIDLDFHGVDEKEVCLLTIDFKSPTPVFIKDETNTFEEFYIRRQGSTCSLKVDEVTPYIQSNWS